MYWVILQILLTRETAAKAFWNNWNNDKFLSFSERVYCCWVLNTDLSETFAHFSKRKLTYISVLDRWEREQNGKIFACALW